MAPLVPSLANPLEALGMTRLALTVVELLTLVPTIPQPIPPLVVPSSLVSRMGQPPGLRMAPYLRLVILVQGKAELRATELFMYMTPIALAPAVEMGAFAVLALDS